MHVVVTSAVETPQKSTSRLQPTHSGSRTSPQTPSSSGSIGAQALSEYTGSPTRPPMRSPSAPLLTQPRCKTAPEEDEEGRSPRLPALVVRQGGERPWVQLRYARWPRSLITIAEATEVGPTRTVSSRIHGAKGQPEPRTERELTHMLRPQNKRNTNMLKDATFLGYKKQRKRN